MYIESSRDISNSTVANNTILLFSSYSCHNCRLSFYCFSNSTAEDYRPSLLYSNAKLSPNTSDYYITVLEADRSGLFVHNIGHNTREGVYTCEVADSNENIIYLTIGVYTSLSMLILFM